jgi:hypothetical protein
MLRAIRNRGRKLSLSDIDNLEKVIGYELPSDYKRFLLKYNGGNPKQGCCDIHGTGEAYIGEFIGVNCFYWIDGPKSERQKIKELYDIEWNYSVYRGRIPNNFLPISSDEGDNQICLSLYGEDRGSIWYWDHNSEHYPPSYSNCYRVADSFQELLEGMFEYDFENDVRLPDVAD